MDLVFNIVMLGVAVTCIGTLFIFMRRYDSNHSEKSFSSNELTWMAATGLFLTLVLFVGPAEAPLPPKFVTFVVAKTWNSNGGPPQRPHNLNAFYLSKISHQE